MPIREHADRIIRDCMLLVSATHQRNSSGSLLVSTVVSWSIFHRLEEYLPFWVETETSYLAWNTSQVQVFFIWVALILAILQNTLVVLCIFSRPSMQLLCSSSDVRPPWWVETFFIWKTFLPVLPRMFLHGPETGTPYTWLWSSFINYVQNFVVAL
jgi:hypothetical protein